MSTIYDEFFIQSALLLGVVSGGIGVLIGNWQLALTLTHAARALLLYIQPPPHHPLLKGKFDPRP